MATKRLHKKPTANALGVDGSTNCLEFSNVYGDNPVIQMVYHANRAVVDLNPFFLDVFSHRDDWLGKPLYYERTKQLDGGVTEYKFTTTEFGEGLFGSYHPKQIIDFLRRHNVEGDIQAESFLKRIERFDSMHREAVVTCCSYRLFGHNYYYFRAINFPVEDLRKSILNTIPRRSISKTAPKHTSHHFRGENLEGKETSAGLPLKVSFDDPLLHKIRESLSNQQIPIVLFVPHSLPLELDNISLLREYRDTDATKLRVVKV